MNALYAIVGSMTRSGLPHRVRGIIFVTEDAAFRPTRERPRHGLPPSSCGPVDAAPSDQVVDRISAGAVVGVLDDGSARVRDRLAAADRAHDVGEPIRPRAPERASR